MKCPTCNVDLKMADRQGIEIDYCPQCRGVWLDRGELDKIIERSSSAVPAQAAPAAAAPVQGEYRESFDRDDDDRYPYSGREQYPARKKRSFLGDMFDF
jgi:uncharacterized protein